MEPAFGEGVQQDGLPGGQEPERRGVKALVERINPVDQDAAARAAGQPGNQRGRILLGEHSAKWLEWVGDQEDLGSPLQALPSAIQARVGWGNPTPPDRPREPALQRPDNCRLAATGGRSGSRNAGRAAPGCRAPPDTNARRAASALRAKAPHPFRGRDGTGAAVRTSRNDPAAAADARRKECGIKIGGAAIDRLGPFVEDSFADAVEVGEIHVAAGSGISLARSSSEARQRPSDIRFQLRAIPLARSHHRLGSV